MWFFKRSTVTHQRQLSPTCEKTFTIGGRNGNAYENVSESNQNIIANCEGQPVGTFVGYFIGNDRENKSFLVQLNKTLVINKQQNYVIFF